MNFICPVCSEKLIKVDKAYKCKNCHSFDIAKQGYVNLLMNQQSAGKHHGDDKLMVNARRSFLEKGYYSPLREALCRCVSNYVGEEADIIDCGCGEGWYCERIYAYLCSSGCNAHMAGIDISKAALISLSKRTDKISMAVASAFRLPFAEESANMLLNIFSPLACDEFRRVLKSGGTLIRVVPLERHLFELKALVYDKPYENEAESTALEGFELVEKIEVADEITIDNNEDIQSLFMMTPYYYKTSAADQAKLRSVQRLKTRTEFGILIYKKI